MKFPIAAAIFCSLAVACLAGKAIISRETFRKHMLANGIPEDDLFDWHLIVGQATGYNLRHKTKVNNGIFNIGNQWCGPGKPCNVTCDKLRDLYLEDDIRCAKLIFDRFKGKDAGFGAWAPYHKPMKGSKVMEVFVL